MELDGTAFEGSSIYRGECPLVLVFNMAIKNVRGLSCLLSTCRAGCQRRTHV